MLPEWYFCCCIGIGADKTFTFLSILDAIDGDEADDALTFFAYSEICRAETWMQIYALPHILRSLHRKTITPGAQMVIQKYLGELLELLPDNDTHNIFENLMNSLLGQEPGVIIQAIKECASKIKQLPLRTPTERPYLDLETFLPETLLLAALFDQYTNNESFVAAFAPDLEIGLESSPIGDVLKDSINMQFGRQAFLLAARLSPFLSNEYSRYDIARKIWLTPDGAAAYEPDLLATTADVLYFDEAAQEKEDLGKPAQAVWAMVNEALSLAQWNRLETYRQRGKNYQQHAYEQNIEAVLRRLDISPSDRISPLPYVLWQLTLWELAARIDAETAARQLARHWLTPRVLSNPITDITIGGPYSKEEGERWASNLKTLATLRFDDNVEINYQSGERFPSVRPMSWLFFSPWLHFNRDTIYKRGPQRTERQLRYPKALEGVSLIRLLAATTVAIRLIKYWPQERSIKERDIFAALIVHAQDVLISTYQNWLRGGYQNPSTNRGYPLSEAMTGLALFCGNLIKYVGQAEIEKVAPEIFLGIDLLGQDERKGSDDRSLFQELVLPQVLFFWIEGAYIWTTWQEVSGPGRWIPLIPEVNKLTEWNADWKYDYYNKIRAALIVRYLTKVQINLGKLDWRETKHQNKWRNIGQRLLLLSPELDAGSWLPPNWEEPDWDAPNAEPNWPGLRLVLAIQRLAALEENDQTVSSETKAAWFTEWRSCMNSKDQINFDRFARLRLLELLDKPALANSSDDQELIALTILERGSVYELSKLIERLYWKSDQGISTRLFAPANETRWSVRRSFLKAMYLYTGIVSKTLDESQEDARTPRAVQYETEKRLFVQRTLLFIGYLAQEQGRSELQAVVKKKLDEKPKQVLTMIQSEVELRGESKQLVLPENIGVREWMLRGAVYDPNMLKYTLYYANFKTDELVNFFEAAREDIVSFLDKREQPDRPVRMVGVIVNEIYNRQESGQTRYKYILNCGLPFYLETPWIEKRLPRRYPATYVSVGVYWTDDRSQGAHTNGKAQLRTHSDLRLLEHSVEVGEGETVDVREEWSDRLGRRRLLLRYRGEGYYRQVDWRLWKVWDADTSRAFHRFSELQERKVIVQADANGNSVPLERDLLQLFLDGHSFAAGQIFVLALIGEPRIDTLTGEQSWLFSTAPGKNYRLNKNAFSPGDVDDLEQEILRTGDENDAVGLLIAVEPFIDELGHTVYLRLARDAMVDKELEAFYPGLSFPFDWRNYEWRTLFDRENLTFKAERERSNGQWFVDPAQHQIQIPGFPSKIRVEWERYQPDDDEHEANLVSPRWSRDSWRGQGDEPYISAYGERMLEIEPRSDWQDFLERWLKLRAGSHIMLDRVISPLNAESEGRIVCLTDERIKVFVDAESLTMEPFESQDRLRIEQPREAEVYWCSSWRSLDHLLKIPSTSQVPAAAFEKGICLGILVGVPSSSGQSAICKVLWKTYDKTGYEVADLNIANFRQLARFLVPGCQIRGKLTQAGQEFEAYTRVVWAKALWSVQEWNHKSRQSLLYLGKARYQGQDRPIAEGEPGEVVVLPSVREGAQNLAEVQIDDTGSVEITKAGIESTAKFASRTRRNDPFDGLHRLVLMRGNSLLAGYCPRWPGGSSLILSEVKLSIERRDSKYASLRREFLLHAIAPEASARKAGIDLVGLKEKLLDYLKSPRDLKGIIRSNRTVELQDMQVPVDATFKEWGALVPLADGERPFVVDANPSALAVVHLLQGPSGRILASFRRVPPVTLEGYRISLGATFGIRANLEYPLYYVGKEEVDPVTEVRYEEICYRFEWGPGWTLLVPKSQLLFNGRPFESLDLLLYYGDLITAVTFKLDDSSVPEGQGQDQEQPPRIILDINNYEFSQARTLFTQRKSNMVHVLYLSLVQDRVRINYVEGFAERTDAATFRFTRVRSEMRLTKESEEQLLLRMRTREKESLCILGRLDAEHFVRSLGKEVLFEHVRFSFRSTEDRRGLENNELVFVEAGYVEPTKNDMMLYLKQYPGLDPEDIGVDMRSIVILRRNFSVREDLLNRIYEYNKSYLVNKVLLVKVFRSRRGEINCSIVDGVPSRKPTAMRFSEQSADLLAAWVREVKGEGIRIELQPGVFVALPAARLKSYPSHLTKGAIVRIERIEEQDGVKFAITRASYGDEHYIPSADTRLAVTLPKNYLLDSSIFNEGTESVDSDAFWEDKAHFTIGGLPNIVASAGTYHSMNRYWSLPRAADFIRLMETPHPKIVRLGKDGESNLIAPAPHDADAGRLELKPGSLEVSYVRLGGGTESRLSLLWRYQSFGDETIRQIIERIGQEPWHYHDSKTGHWSKQQGIEHQNLPKYSHTTWTGPVFFERRGEAVRLRYGAENFLKYGFPVGELLSSLKRTPQDARTYPVAGVFREGLWLELAPGHVAELPAQLVVRLVKGRERRLANLNWLSFAPGDEVTLSIFSDDPLSIERFVLEEWKPGVRAVFTGSCCTLPVLRYDATQGGLRLGQGEFGLTIPVERFGQSQQAVVLYPTNRFTPALGPDSEALKTDAIILLGLNAKGIPVILGLPGLTPEPFLDISAQWKSNQVSLVELMPSGEYNYIPGKLREVIRAVGGVLPVTVERFSPEERRVFFSMRRQQQAASIVPGSITQARVLGVMYDGGKVVAILRIGGGITSLPMSQIISGLPPGYTKVAAKILKNIPIWLRCTHEGNIEVGLAEERSVEIMVDALDVIAPEDGNEPGLLCQSIDTLRLYWLPASRSSWTQLSADQLRRVFVETEDKQSFKVRLRDKYPTPGVSAIGVQEIRKEWRSLDVGKRLHVRILDELDVEESDGLRRYLAQNISNRMIVRCEVYSEEGLQLDQEQGVQKSIPVEVTRRVFGSPPLVFVTPLGKKRYVLDLPTWIPTRITRDLHGPQIETGTQPRDIYKQWSFDKLLDLSQYSSDAIRSAEDALLEELLYSAYMADPSRLLEFKADVAYEWFKRHIEEPQMNVAPALMAIILLDTIGRSGEGRRNNSNTFTSSEEGQRILRDFLYKALLLTRDLGNRALRSVHVEVITSFWLENERNNTRRVGLWKRLQELKSHMQSDLKGWQIDDIRQFCQAVYLRKDNDIGSLLPISESLAAAIGQSVDFEQLMNETSVTRELIAIYGTLPNSRYSVRQLHSSHLFKLRSILQRIMIQKFDITLLDPIPELILRPDEKLQ